MRLELTRRADYGVRAMLVLGRLDDGLVSARRIASEMSIPHGFVGQIMGDLVRAGLATAQTGRGGGYRLTRPADLITLLAIVEAVEGDARRRTCVLRSTACSWSDRCDVHEVFASAQDALLEQLASATLATITSRRVDGARQAGWRGGE
jgi:Rrf2 family protein